MLTYYSDKNLDFFEIKKVQNKSQAEKTHFHDELSIIFIENSFTHVSYEKKTYKHDEKSLVLIPPYEPHQCVPTDKEKFSFILIYVSFDWIKESFGIESLSRDILEYKLSDEDIADFKSYIKLLESDKLTIEKELILMDFMEKFIIKRTQLFDDSFNSNFSEKAKLKLIREYLEVNFKQNISLEALSNISGLSKYHLTRSFKSEYKSSPLNYIKNIKLNYAKKALREENTSISELALELGYYDQSYFSNDFRKFSGLSPKNYRKSHLEKNK